MMILLGSLKVLGSNFIILTWLWFRRLFGDLCACFACLESRDDDGVHGVFLPKDKCYDLSAGDLSKQLPGSSKTTSLPFVRRGRANSGFWLAVFVSLRFFRFGEALNPGPNSPEEWHFGVFNPSGLCSKTDQLVHMPGDIWVASETHLTRSGVVKLRSGLRSLQSHYRYLVPGHPCDMRSSSDVGVYSGVAMISKFPSRPLPHDFSPDSFQLSRIQIAGVQVAGQWIQVGMLYGMPKGKTHRNALFQTEILLEQLVERVGCQAVGPRIVCGDFNFEEASLYQTKRLTALGFVEVQSYAEEKWGQQQEPTGRGTKKLDQIWISAELRSQLLSVEVQHDWWPDHAIVQCRFRSFTLDPDTQIWRTPKPFPWPSDWDGIFQFDANLPLTEAYAKLWIDIESQACSTVNAHGGGVSTWSKGRAQTLAPCRVRQQNAPCKLGRQGDLNPTFHGVSSKHAKWFKQLRRIQALVRCTAKPLSQKGFEKCLELWQAIRHAPGFGGGFCQWWFETFGRMPFADGIPWYVPSHAELVVMFEAFQKLVRDFEQQLKGERIRNAKESRRQDLNVVFQDCGKEASPAIDSLVKVARGVIEEVRSDDQSIVFHQPFDFLPDCNVVCKGEPLELIMHSHDQMWVSDVSRLQPGDVVVQERIFTTDSAILRELERVWTERWIKLQHVQEGQWSQITNFICNSFQPIQWTFKEITCQQFEHVVSRKKRRAATGSDGISRSDLIQLPKSAMQAHVDMLQLVEQKGEWPEQLCTGFVASLDKHKGQSDADGYRPITVYPFNYRVWSSIRSGQALRSISKVLPVSVFGGVPGKQAREVWYMMAQLIEQSHADHVPLFGIVLDIRRAFNALPRAPLWSLLKQMNFPEPILKAWATFVSRQVRRFKVRQSVGAPVASCTGLPEGCGMSVFGMVLIDMLLDVWLKAMIQSPHRVFSFVDDWQVAFSDVHQFQDVWQAIVMFTAALDLDVDMAKSFAWAARTDDRPALCEHALQTCLASRVLGAHQNFSCRPGNRTLIDRITGMTQTWVKLKGSLAPLKAKILAIRQLAWPRAMHGIAIVHIGKAHFETLRTGAMKGLKVSRIGANPVLHLASWAPLTDPCFWAIVETCRDARSQGNHDQLRCMLQKFIQEPGSVPNNGPTVVLAHRLQTIGWIVNAQGFFVDQFGSMNIFTMHWDALVARLSWSWPQFMASQVAHRSSFTGLQWADVDETRAALSTFGEADQVFLRCGLDGTLYHDVNKEKCDRGQGSKCEFCGCSDSFKHRIWECSHFAEERKTFSWGHLLSALPSCLTCHGWAITPKEWPALVRLFESIEPPPFVVPSQHDMEVCHLFTDGACSFPKDHKLRYASFAVTIAGTSVSTLEHRVLHVGHVPDQHQTAYRGELYALLVAVRYASRVNHKVCIWSDNQSVVRRIRNMQHGAQVKCNSPHYDLWSEIRDLLDSGTSDRLVVCKVVSHGNHEKAISEVEQWAFWQNALVDAAAGAYNEKRSNLFWQVWQSVADELTASRVLHRAILQVILEVGRKGAKESRDNRSQLATVLPEPPGGLEADFGPSQVPVSWVFSGKLIKHCHKSNIELISKWWLDIGVPQLTVGVEPVWISGLQLYVDFLLVVRRHGPTMVKGRWVPGDTQLLCQHQVTTSRRVKMFLTMWKALLVDNGFSVTGKLCRPSSAAIAFWCQSYRLGWSRERLLHIDDILVRILKRQIIKPNELDEIDLLDHIP